MLHPLAHWNCGPLRCSTLNANLDLEIDHSSQEKGRCNTGITIPSFIGIHLNKTSTVGESAIKNSTYKTRSYSKSCTLSARRGGAHRTIRLESDKAHT